MSAVDRQLAKWSAIRVRCMKSSILVLWITSVCVLLFMYKRETTPHSYQSIMMSRRNAMQSGITIQNSSSFVSSTDAPSFKSCNNRTTQGTTLQPATTDNVLSAQICVNNSLSVTTIDLEKEIPPLAEIFNRTVIVTAISSNHFMEAKIMIGHAQRVMPNTRIVVYNLGLTLRQLQPLSTLCNVEVRTFNFSKYPAHVKNLLNYAWKPPIIQETLYEFGAVFWADSSVRFKKSIKLLTPHLKTFHGFIPRVANYAKVGKFSVVALTHPAMFDYLVIDKETYKRDSGFTPKPQGGILYFVNSSYINEKLLQPWVDCAMVLECIAPHGSQNPHQKFMKGYHVHRYDQSSLALLMYKNLRGLYRLGHDATKTFNSVMRVENRGGSGNKAVNVKSCPEKN